MTWKQLTERDRREWKLSAIDPHDRDTWRDQNNPRNLDPPYKTYLDFWDCFLKEKPSRIAQSVGHLTRKSGVLGSLPGLATYFRFSFRLFKKGSYQLLAKVCARSTG